MALFGRKKRKKTARMTPTGPSQEELHLDPSVIQAGIQEIEHMFARHQGDQLMDSIQAMSRARVPRIMLWKRQVKDRGF